MYLLLHLSWGSARCPAGVWEGAESSPQYSTGQRHDQCRPRSKVDQERISAHRFYSCCCCCCYQDGAVWREKKEGPCPVLASPLQETSALLGSMARSPSQGCMRTLKSAFGRWVSVLRIGKCPEFIINVLTINMINLTKPTIT